MDVLCILPDWFLGYGMLLEFIFFLLAAFIAFYSYRVYKITKRKDVKNIFIAFIAFSSSYLIQFLANGVFYIDNNLMPLETILLKTLPMYIYFILYMFALVTLAYAVLKPKTSRFYYLFLAVVLIGIFMAQSPVLVFNLFSVLILLYTGAFAFYNYYRGKRKNNLMFVIFIILLFIGKLPFVFSGRICTCSIIQHIMFSFAYVILFTVLFMVMRYGFEKK
ncbi:MAG: hypothetical protein ACQEP1_01480 [Nanobdellota archaeon]